MKLGQPSTGFGLGIILCLCIGRVANAADEQVANDTSVAYDTIDDALLDSSQSLSRYLAEGCLQGCAQEIDVCLSSAADAIGETKCR